MKQKLKCSWTIDEVNLDGDRGAYTFDVVLVDEHGGDLHLEGDYSINFDDWIAIATIDTDHLYVYNTNINITAMPDELTEMIQAYIEENGDYDFWLSDKESAWLDYYYGMYMDK